MKKLIIVIVLVQDGGVNDLIADSKGRFRLPSNRTLARASPKLGQGIVFFQVHTSNSF